MLPSHWPRPAARLSARDVLVVLALLVGASSLYLYMAVQLEDVVFNRTSAIFGSDTTESAQAMRWFNFRGDMAKHLLFSPVLSTLVKALGAVLPISEAHSMFLAVALLGGFNVGLAFVALRSLGAARSLAGVWAAVYAMFFWNVVLFSIPETYVLSNLLILTYLAILFHVVHRPARSVSVGMGVLAGIAALANPPLLLLSVVHPIVRARELGLRGASRLLVLDALAASLVFTMTNLLVFGDSFPWKLLDRGLPQASVLHFVQPRQGATVVSSFLLFSVISPTANLPSQLSTSDLAHYFNSALGTGLVAVYGAGLLATAARLVRQRDGIDYALIVWALLMGGFYTYFNPQEAILYAGQVGFAILVLIVRTVGTRSSRTTLAAVFGFGLVLALHNLSVVYVGPG